MRHVAGGLQPPAPLQGSVAETPEVLNSNSGPHKTARLSIHAVQVYRRLRGTLFFGPGFAVTKNKLTFCDALDQILADAKPGAAALPAGSRDDCMRLREFTCVVGSHGSHNRGSTLLPSSNVRACFVRFSKLKNAWRNGLRHDLAGEPGVEKAFREWLQRCHAELDKSLRFEDLVEPEAQAAARKKAGVTLFRRSAL